MAGELITLIPTLNDVQKSQKPQMARVQLVCDDPYTSVITTLAVPFEIVRKDAPIQYRGHVFVHHLDYALTDAQHDDEKIDWRANVTYKRATRPTVLPDDTPEVK